MQVQKYPYCISLYKGEKQILIVPFSTHVDGFRVHLDYYHKFPENIDEKDIGNSVLSMIEKINNTPCVSINSKEQEEYAVWKKATKYKGYKSFAKNYLLCSLDFFENGEYKIAVVERADEKGIYGAYIKQIHLQSTATAEEIGQAVLDAFKAAEDFYAE